VPSGARRLACSNLSPRICMNEWGALTMVSSRAAIELDVKDPPTDDKVLIISRAQGTLTFPTNFTLVAAMNPCPCGAKIRQWN